MATKSKTAPATPPEAPKANLEIELTRDELYRIVNACYHAHVELLKNPTFAIRHRSHAYSSVAIRMDLAYQELIEHGPDAVFTVKFFKKDNPSKEKSNEHDARVG